MEIISKIEDHYPKFIKQYFVGTGRVPLTSEQRRSLRNNNCNTNIITNSGNEYALLGCGSVAAGLPFAGIFRSDKAITFVRMLDENQNRIGVLKFDKQYNLDIEQ